MEILLVGNMVLILFWSFMTFISNDTEKYKVIVLIYILTYLVNILNIVPTIESYILLLIALFIYFELFEDHFKKIILKNLIDKLLDFFYRLCAQYAFLKYTLALIISSNYAIDCLGQNTILALYFFSGIFLYLSCSITSKEKYIVSTFDEMKKTIDEKCDYRHFLINIIYKSDIG